MISIESQSMRRQMETNFSQLEGLHEGLQFVTFTIQSGSESVQMALNVQKVKEVVEFGALSLYPDACKNLLGVYDLRGVPVPIFDLTEFVLLGRLAKIEKTSAKRILICDLQNILIGIPVESTGRILNCSGTDFLPPPSATVSDEARITSGLIRLDQGFLPVLDLDSFVNATGLDANVNRSAKNNSKLFDKKTILLVEDSISVRKRLMRLLESYGSKVTAAADGIEALNILQNSNSSFDLLFTDIEMPRLDGINLARAVKGEVRFKEMPIIFNSMLSNPALISDIEASGLGRFLVKFDEKQIIDEIANILKIDKSKGVAA